MKKKAALIIIPLLLMNCASFYKVWYKMFDKTSSYFTTEELAVHRAATEAADYNYGYDPDLGLDYVFDATREPESLRTRKKNMAGALREYETEQVIAYFEKIYRLREMTEKRMEKAAVQPSVGKPDWEKYTYIEKYLLPPLDTYATLLESYVILRDRGYRSIINDRKKAIEEDLRDGKRNKRKKQSEEASEKENA